ncbi:protein SIEVE ELEMENT OCCLUSION B-like isoform X4 [Benincasa hispida]|uniref:protein SIEVE ELEMENT OCCLUSION B-like isoform X4 n=1 Tax=Benincasa hispida TaxID=102211 RepID=UPI001900A10B|nr:protein SIEVE ELEMENT OCCLUSION B-like isoform X4 [Benincasa hispida]
MAAYTRPVPKTHQLAKNDRRMLSASDDNAMTKQVVATHAPDGREVNVKPILLIVEEVIRRATPDIGKGNGQHEDMFEDQISSAEMDGVLEPLAHVIQKVGAELACKCSGGDAHATTMAILNLLSNYSWDAKVVITMAAFAVNYGQYWLLSQLYTTNMLAKALALLKQLPDVIEHSNSLKPQFDALSKLITAVLNVTKCIVKFTELPSHYISPDTPAMSVALAHFPTAAYWTIKSVVACTSLIESFVSLSHELIISTTEVWELSSLAHKETNIHEHLQTQLDLCLQHIDEKRHLEAYQNLVRISETLHLDNMKFIRALISAREDIQPLYDGTSKLTVHLEILKRKHVLLLISDLDISHEEVMIVDNLFKESQQRPEIRYEIVWIPIIDRSIQQHSKNKHKFEELKQLMPWYSVYDPSIIEQSVIRYIKEKWNFKKKTILVALDPQGKVSSTNALHMLWIWGNLAFPFTSEREEALWKTESWRLELLIDGIDLSILDWAAEGRYICIFGGEDTEWIKEFTSKTKQVAEAANVDLQMAYVGKNNAKERVRKISIMIADNKLSHYWPDSTLVWFFWARLESMMYSKLNYGKTVENDQIMQEIMTLLSFDGSDKGWAIFFGRGGEMARAKGETALSCILAFDQWKEEVEEKGFLKALAEYLQQLRTPHHCNRLILPGLTGNIPENVVCAECGRAMEKYLMYRCCVE